MLMEDFCLAPALARFHLGEKPFCKLQRIALKLQRIESWIWIGVCRNAQLRAQAMEEFGHEPVAAVFVYGEQGQT
jgi:hypothetical protein